MNLTAALFSALVVSFVLSGLESAILSLSRVRLRHAAKEKARGAIRIEKILTHRGTLLITIVALNNAVTLTAFALVTHLAVERLGAWGYLAAFAVSLPVFLIWIELLPKALFQRAPIRSLRFFSPLLWFLSVVPGLLIKLLAIPARGLVFMLFGRPPAPPGASREEFRALTEVFEREGTLDPAETRLIHNVLDFHKVQVRDVMLPLSRVTAVPLEMPLTSVMDLARQTEIDQFPLIGPGGDLVGIINVMELLRDQADRGTADRYRRALIESSPTEAAIAVVKRLRRSGQHLAAVYDENHQPVGIVSAHDAVERMVQVTG